MSNIATAPTLTVVPSDKTPVLEARKLNAWYDESHVLHGVDIQLNEGELVVLIGKNGAGKTTTLRSIMGIGPRATGEIHLFGRPILGRPPEAIGRLGLAYCPEERAIFSSLTVEENLFLPPVIGPNGLSVEEIFELFPNLKERLATQGTKLSGGEQQMLAIARILRTGARVLMLDEPTEGLAPVIVEQIAKTIAILKKKGFTILLVEQNLAFAMSVLDRIYLVDQGRTVDVLDKSAASARIDDLKAWLSV
ncbi:ABC transporter ATP-binding protein [Rhizobium sp. Root708]|uniref:ABC transporter ATP-binding protein n=1 Tax=Rhizobium sp. Root708 TaxID=1736592 RepID=UPI0007004ACE|nr:ABC transporter ATP-binding protein [Rhizobium sp. Root708]KRB49082.1 ABC transporter ATP-binding protein [Rhizobium sp. Root708]